MNHPYRDKDYGGGCLVFKISVEFERDQSIHPPANGSCSSEGEIENGWLDMEQNFD